jgi:hypothetical protein
MEKVENVKLAELKARISAAAYEVDSRLVAEAVLARLRQERVRAREPITPARGHLRLVR